MASETDPVDCHDPPEEEDCDKSVNSVGSFSVSDETNRAAILLVDFQNEFMKEGGKLHDLVAETMSNTGVLENIPNLVEFARKTGAMIIYSPIVMNEEARLKAENTNDVFLKNEYKFFAENTWNCEIVHEVEPRNSDVILTDRADYNAFVGTKLLSILKENNVNHLFLAGFLTNVCVSKTSQAAVEALPGMETYVISDGCAAKSMDAHEAALENVSKKGVNIVSSAVAKSIFAECAASKRKSTLAGSDEWLMIEKIFSAGGVGKNKRISVDELQSIVAMLPSSSSVLSDLSNTMRKKGGNRMSRVDMHKILFQRKPRSGFFEKLPLFIVMVYLPLFYSISTRIPFIFVALEITEARGRELWEVGLILGVYQTSRAVGNLLIVSLGGKNPMKRLQLPLIFSALFGWFFLALYDRTGPGLFSFKPNFGDDSQDVRALFALFWVGLCETIVILQRSLMTETANESPSGIIDEGVLAKRFSIQYSLVSLGAVVAFVLGGWLYTEYGYFVVCDFGILIQIAHLIGVLLYFILAKKSKRDRKTEDLQGNDLIRSVIYQFQSVSVIAKYAQDVANGTENAWTTEGSGMSAAIASAKQDHVLNHSLKQIFQYYFGKRKDRDDVSAMEEFLESIEKLDTGVTLASRRPHAVAVGKRKLAKLILFFIKSTEDSMVTESEFVSFWAPRVYLSMFESSRAASVSVTWPYMKAVIMTQAIAALCIGIFLSTALLSYTERFGVDAARVGLLLGIGEGLGVITIFGKSFLPDRGKKPGILATIISRPLNVPCVLILASLCSMFFSINNFGVAVLCQMVYSSVNDLSVSLMNELAGTSLPADKFKYYQGTGQWLRRVGNMITAILGPIFFGIDKSLPFLFFGAIVFVWALVLWFLMYAHADRMRRSLEANDWAKSDTEEPEEEEESVCCDLADLAEPFRPFMETCKTPWHEQEQMYYVLNKERLEEELNTWSKTRVDISMMEHRIRRIAAALEVEKDQRRALEDNLYARVSSSDNGWKDEAENLL